MPLQPAVTGLLRTASFVPPCRRAARPHVSRRLHERFHDAFEGMGEPGIPIDRQFMATPEFPALLQRLRGYAEQHDRDHWCGLLSRPAAC